jgi:hypothetical protein
MITAWICALRNGSDAMAHGSISELSTMPAMGQTEKHSARADVFRSYPKNGHWFGRPNGTCGCKSLTYLCYFCAESARSFHVGLLTNQRTVSRSQGTFVFNAGEWRAKLGDEPLHGYYTAIIVRDGDQAKIMEETVTVAAPGQ